MLSFQNYCARLCFDGYVSEHYQNALMNFRGLKILAVQDDYDQTATLHRAIRRTRLPRPTDQYPERLLAARLSKIRAARAEDHPGLDGLCAGATH